MRGWDENKWLTVRRRLRALFALRRGLVLLDVLGRSFDGEALVKGVELSEHGDGDAVASGVSWGWLEGFDVWFSG